MFHADAEPTGLDKLAQGAKAERVFLKLLDLQSEIGVRVSQAGGRNYAPKLFADHPDAEGCKQPAFKGAMASLLSRKFIVIGEDGPPSKRRTFIERGQS